MLSTFEPETSVYVTGIVKDERSKFDYELDITDIEVIGESILITPKNTEQTSWWTTVTCGSVL